MRRVTYDLSCAGSPVIDINTDDHRHCATTFPCRVETPLARCFFGLFVDFPVDTPQDVRTTHITFVTDYGQQCHGSKILLVRSRRRRGTTFFGAAPLGGADGGQKPLSCAQHTVPMAKAATSAGFRIIEAL